MNDDMTNVYRNEGKPISYHGITYELDDRDTKKLSETRAKIRQALGDAIVLAPEGTLHITIFNITPVSNYGIKNVAAIEFYEQNEKRYEEALEELAAKTKKFEIRLSNVEAGEDAIILRGYDSGNVGKIRRFLADLPTQNAKQIGYDFIHSSQARYARSLRLTEVQSRVTDIKVDTVIGVGGLSLVRANVEFTESHEILRSFDLL